MKKITNNNIIFKLIFFPLTIGAPLVSTFKIVLVVVGSSSSSSSISLVDDSFIIIIDVDTAPDPVDETASGRLASLRQEMGGDDLNQREGSIEDRMKKFFGGNE